MHKKKDDNATNEKTVSTYESDVEKGLQQTHTTKPEQTEGVNRTRSNQRWMKLRTTVQLSGAIQKSKPTLKREDSFIQRFSTRHTPNIQETIDAGEEDESISTDDKNKKSAIRVRRRRLRRKRTPCTVINTDGNFYYYWLMLITCGVFYFSWTLIVRQTFPEVQEVAEIYWCVLDIFFDTIFFLDILVQLRTGYLEQGLIVIDSLKLIKNYIRSRAFMMDMIALAPLQWIPISKPVPIFRIVRLLKVYRACDFYYMVESRTLFPNVLRVFNLVHILLVLAHWFGCFYFMISEYGQFRGDWSYPYRPGPFSTLVRKYLASVYWSTLTLTTIGDLPSPEEPLDVNGFVQRPKWNHQYRKSRLLQFDSNIGYIFTIASYLIGVFIFATIVGQVGNVITNRNASRLEFERLLDGAKSYMRHHKVPSGMKRRVLRWYDYSWSRRRIHGGGDVNTALALLPDKLKTELALHVNLNVLKKVTIFQKCQPEFLHDLVLKMKAYIFTPGDLVCRKGEIAREMFIISDGILEVISETGRVLSTMQEGDFFGEIGILNLDGLNKRTADVRSVGYSELFSLSREDVLSAMKDYPEAKEILQSMGRKRLMEARNINKAVKNNAQHSKLQRSASIHETENEDDSSKTIIDKILTLDLRNKLWKTSKKSTRNNDSSEDNIALRKTMRSGNKATLTRMAHVCDDSIPGGVTNTIIDETQHSSLQSVESIDNDSIKSPKKIQKNEELDPTNPNLPFLQRVKLLKAKEEKEKALKNKIPPVIDINNQSIIQIKESNNNTVNSNNSSFDYKKNASVDTKPDKSESDKQCLIQSRPWNTLKNATVLSEQTCKTTTINRILSKGSNSIEIKDLKLTQISKTLSENEKVQLSKQESIGFIGVEKGFEDSRSNTLKIYKSVDDLSPEYKSLPFVKKLKILNERQKYTEFIKQYGIRSSSLDSPDSLYHIDPNELTRSSSEEVGMELVFKNQTKQEFPFNLDKTMPSESKLINNNTETAERIRLKSILKKLSGITSLKKPEAETSSQEFKHLIRAQTIEGYAARHMKLIKSVTFNKAQVHSPQSGDYPLIEDNHNLVESIESQKTDVAIDIKDDNSIIETSSFDQNIIEPLTEMIESDAELFETNNPDDLSDGNYVVSESDETNKLNFNEHFKDLQGELRKKDIIIDCLQRRVQELEDLLTSNSNISTPNTDVPFMRAESVVTVVSPSERRSIGDIIDESLENNFDNSDDANENKFPSLFLEGIETSDSMSSTESDEELPYIKDWEVQLLAEQMEQQDELKRTRATSIDINASASINNQNSVDTLATFQEKLLEQNKKERKLRRANSALPLLRRRTFSIGSLQEPLTNSFKSGFDYLFRTEKIKSNESFDVKKENVASSSTHSNGN